MTAGPKEWSGLTVFAPTNEAFEDLPEGALANLLKPKNKERLQNLLLFHVASGNILSISTLSMEMILRLSVGRRLMLTCQKVL